METITRVLNSIFQFVVGDWRLLIGVALTLALVALSAAAAPAVAGVALLALIALTLLWSLQREARR